VPEVRTGLRLRLRVGVHRSRSLPFRLGGPRQPAGPAGGSARQRESFHAEMDTSASHRCVKPATAPLHWLCLHQRVQREGDDP
jgi:hypothetical protein